VDRLLQIKLAEPHPRRLVSRPRLIELLDRTLDVRLALLSAPPGFGKTSALVDWLAVRKVRSAWVLLDAGDNDVARFIRYLWAAAASLACDGDSPLDGISSGDTEDAIDELAALLEAAPGPSVLVLDDYHTVEAAAVQAAVSRLIDRMPPSVHLAIATRADPTALPIARLRARGDLLEIRADALRFSAEEARRFVAGKVFAFTCADGTRGAGRILDDMGAAGAVLALLVVLLPPPPQPAAARMSAAPAASAARSLSENESATSSAGSWPRSLGVAVSSRPRLSRKTTCIRLRVPP